MAPDAAAATMPAPGRPSLRLVLGAHIRAQFLELIRYPAFIVPTLSLPMLFFLVFGVPNASTPGSATRVATSYLAFAVLGVMLFKFGVGVSVSREWSWERFLRVLGVSPAIRFAARSGAGLLFLVLAAFPVVLVAEAATPVSLPAARWLSIGVILVVGSIPFALLGVAIGYAVEPKAAVPVANLVYLGLAYGGGLFQNPSSLPRAIRTISQVFPTRMWGELLRRAGTGQTLPWENAAGLAVWAVVFFALSRWGFQRDEGKTYR